MPRDGGKTGHADEPKTREEADERLRAFFKYGDDYDADALAYVTDELKKLQQYFEEDNTRQIRGMSVFIVADSAQRSYGLKCIDLISLEPLPEPEEGKPQPRDEGLIHGVKTLLEMIGQITCKSE